MADPEHTPDGVVSLALQTIEACDYAGISLRIGRGEVSTVASTDRLVDQADALQYQFDEGPCLDAIRAQDVYVAHDLRTDPRWPRWGPRAASLRLGSLLSVRLATPRETIGALNLYAADLDAFDHHDIEVACVFSAHAALALRASQLVDGLQTALVTRHSIGLAQGILMERYGLGADAAFAVLRRYSQDTNTKLRTVAEDVVRDRALPAGATAPTV